MTPRYRVAVFARNEEQHILTALSALLEACPRPRDLKLYVLVNGCTDATLDIVRRFAEQQPEVVGVSLPFGDKANAWNTYVHELADDSPCHFFTDGDVTCSPGALTHMQASLLAEESAMAIAGVPLSGRHRDRYTRYVHDWHWLYGGLHAIKTVQLRKLRERGVRLPLGICGSDHFISKFAAAWTLDPTELHWEQNTYRPDAGYLFRPLAFYRPSDVRVYVKQQVTYALRQLQIPEMDALPLTELPATVDAVNRRILARLDAAHLGPSDLFSRAVRRRLRRMYPTPEAIWFERFLPLANQTTASDTRRPA